MFRLDGQTALVTGASGGIGRAIAQAFSEAGASVVLAWHHRKIHDLLTNDVDLYVDSIIDCSIHHESSFCSRLHGA